MEGWISFDTELGWIALAWGADGLRLLRFTGGQAIEAEGRPPAWVRRAVEALTRHGAGRPSELAQIPLALASLSPFARRVTDALRATRPGETLTYGHLAALAGSPGAARAVGRAVANNPLPILIPCHRVVSANGPGGFSLFGGPEIKARLLALDALLEGHGAATPR